MQKERMLLRRTLHLRQPSCQCEVLALVPTQLQMLLAYDASCRTPHQLLLCQRARATDVQRWVLFMYAMALTLHAIDSAIGLWLLLLLRTIALFT
jgi:hypothetical protein